MCSFLVFALSIGLVLSRNYYLIKQSKKYSDAKKYCNQNFGTELASLNSQSDVNDMRKLVGGYSVIIGLKQVKGGAGKSANDFGFDDGTSPGFKPFSPGEPNNAGGEDCVELYGGSGKLNDIPCHVARYFVCNAASGKIVRKYYKTNKVLSWSNAQIYCQRVYGTDLATWRDAADYYNLDRIIGGHSVWTGLYQKDKKLSGKNKNDFVFIDDPTNQVKYKPFNAGEPNNAGNNENCAELMGGNGKLNDLNCAAARGVVCNGATYAKPKKYVLVPTSLDFKKANEHCKSVYGTTLATFRNGADYNSFQKTVGNTGVWVGMYQKDKSKPGKNPSDFIYIDGSKSVYRPFGPGEPNNAGGEDCVEYIASTQLLNDLKCTWSRSFACNLELEANPRKYIDAGVGRNWKDAMNYCKSKYGTTLATFRHGSDYYEFEKMAKGRSTWVGLKSTVTKDDFEYVDGLKVNYKPFGPGEPNNAAGEDCVEYIGGLRRLNDLNCANARHVICNAKNYNYKPKPQQPVNVVLVSKPLAFKAANDYCIEKYDTELVAVNNKIDQELVKTICKVAGGKCYIGLTDLPEFTEDKEDYWFLDGSKSDFPGWLTGEPKIEDGNGCAYMDNNKGGKWGTVPCNTALPFLCARNEEEIPPSALKASNSLDNKANHENNRNNFFEINFASYDGKFNIKYFFMSLISISLLIIGLTCGLVYTTCIKKNDKYKAVAYITSDSDCGDEQDALRV